MLRRRRRRVADASTRARSSRSLTNLVVNAIQAMPTAARSTSSVERAPRAAAPTAEAAAARRASRVAVRDSGPASRRRDLPHIFEPFFTTKDVGEGTGLGLSVAYGIVREHGGWIDGARASRARAATFTVYLPDAEALR